jgi:hypothetical protein
MKVRTASLLLLDLAVATPCIACQCGQIPDPKQAMAMVPLVVVGRVEALREEDISPLFSNKIVRISVERVWKGDAPSDLTLVVGSSDCDYVHFQMNERYLIFVEAMRGARSWTASKCKPTRPLAQAAEEIRLIGPGKPKTHAPGRSNSWGLGHWFSAFLVIVAVGAALSLLPLYFGRISGR